MGKKRKVKEKDTNLSVLLGRYPYKGVVIDTQLLVLYLVGIFNPNDIKNNKRTCDYSLTDFNLLLKVMQAYSKIIITQSVLAETTNHLDTLNRKYNTTFYSTIANILTQFEAMDTKTKDVLTGPTFSKLGFTDASLDILSKEYVVLTHDEPLWGQIISQRGMCLYWPTLDPTHY